MFFAPRGSNKIFWSGGGSLPESARRGDPFAPCQVPVLLSGGEGKGQGWTNPRSLLQTHSQHTGRCPHLHCHRGPAPACPSPERWPIASHSCLRAGVGKSRPTFVKHRALISLLSPRPHQARTRAPLRMARSVPHAAFAARRPPLNTAWPCHLAPHTVGCKARPQPCPVE